MTEDEKAIARFQRQRMKELAGLPGCLNLLSLSPLRYLCGSGVFMLTYAAPCRPEISA